MGVIELFILAVGLSMDAFAVSVCKGLAMKKAPAKAAKAAAKKPAAKKAPAKAKKADTAK